MLSKNAMEYNEKHVCQKCGKMLEGTVSDSLRARKYESFIRMKTKRFNRLAKIGAFIFPGTGKIFQERQFKGMILFTCASITGLLFFSQHIFAVRNPHIMNNIPFNNSILLAIILLVLYLISIGITKESK